MWYIADLPIIDRNHALVVVSFMFTILALIVISLRLYTRAIVIRTLGWDDWLMTGAMFTSICFVVTVFFQIKYGLGEPANPATIVNFLISIYCTVALYNLTQTLYKLSITIQSYRVFTTVSGRRIMTAVIVWITLCGIMSLTGSLFYCNPVPKAWDDFIPGTCADRSALIYTFAGFNIFNDIILLIIPAPFILSLQVAKKQRIVLISVFSSGLTTTIISIVRLKSLYDSMSQPIDQQPVTGVDIALWSGLEINVAIICGSVPAIKAFISNVVLGKSLGSSGSRSYAVGSAGASRLKSRSRITDTETGDDIEQPSPMNITVQKDIEMKTYVADDQGSESELIGIDGFGPQIQSRIYVHGKSEPRG